MWILFHDPDHRLIGRHALVWECVAARLAATRLDRALAQGAPPEGSALLAVRAQILVRPRMRRDLARCLRRVLAEVDGPGPARSRGRVPLMRDRIAAARPALLEMIEYVSGPGPVSAAVVAGVRDLLTDGVGPLYNRRSQDDLRERARQALDALEQPQP